MNNKKSISIPTKMAYYITGFADGEGSFNTSFRKRDDFLIGWKVSPVFNISQKERTILALIKHHLGCGSIRFRKDNVWVYEVHNIKSIQQIVIPFFNKFHFLSEKKKKDFVRFKKIVEIKQKKKALTVDDIQSILQLLTEVESKNSRKYSDSEILERACLFWRTNREKICRLNTLSLESSETTRQT